MQIGLSEQEGATIAAIGFVLFVASTGLCGPHGTAAELVQQLDLLQSLLLSWSHSKLTAFQVTW